MNLIQKLFWNNKEVSDWKDVFIWWTIINSNFIFTSNLELYNDFYKQNTDIRAAEDDISKLILSGWYYFINNKNEKIKDEKINRKLNYILNSFLDFDKWKNIFTIQADIFWDVFVYLARNISWDLIGLQILDPKNIYIIKDKFWREVWYKLNGSNDKIIYSTEQIKHYYESTDLLKVWDWLSKLETLVNEIISDWEISKSNAWYFKTWRIPKTLIVFRKWLKENEKRVLFKQLKEYYKWWENQYKVWSFDWIERIEKVADDFDWTLFNWMRDFNTNRILKALWVPSIRLHEQNAKYSNQGEIFVQYLEWTIKPKEKALAKFINNIFEQEFKWLYKFAYNEERFIDNKIKTDLINTKLKSWLITINEWRKELWMELSNEEEANKLIVSKNQILIEDLWIAWFENEKINDEE